MKMIKIKIVCAIMAAAVALGAVAVPTIVMAEDLPGCLDDLDDLTPEEMYILRHLEDLDDDGDIDEHDIDIIETLLYMGVLDNYEKYLAMDIIHHAHEQERNSNVSVTGIYFNSAGVTLVPGQTFQDVACVDPDNATNKGVSYYSSDTRVAAIDQNGVITAIAPGSCIVTAISSDGNYSARACVNVNAGAPAAAQSQSDDSAWMNNAAAIIAATPAGGTADLVAAKPVSFDGTVISALINRPDVSVLVAYPYKGHTYLLSIPAGYNLGSKVDGTGKVSVLYLAAVNDGQVRTVMTQ